MMLRNLLPKTLFARALLIVVLPTVFVQLVTATVFFDRHVANLTRYMGNALAGEIAFFAQEFEKTPQENRSQLISSFSSATGIYVSFKERENIDESALRKNRQFPDLRRALIRKTEHAFLLEHNAKREEVNVSLQLEHGVLRFSFSTKRLESPTTSIFLLWMIGASCIFLLIALLFLRNQVRPIRELAEAAESFGKGLDVMDLKPHGAQEVRRAARAFLVMRERILRQVRTRTEMLAGISHDLRTPLTRMKLQLTMQRETPESKELLADVAQMEHMVSEYLDFARGDAGEDAQPMSLHELLTSTVADYKRSKHDVPLTLPQEDATLMVRVNAVRRMLHNLIDNALRYGTTCRLSAQIFSGKVEIYVEDNGPGIPEEAREEVFRPFRRMDSSRNLNTGGVGLGLTIARDIARSHGGNIELKNSDGGGLRVIIRLPV